MCETMDDRNKCLVLAFCVGLLLFLLLACRSPIRLATGKRIPIRVATQESEEKVKKLWHDIKRLKQEVKTLKSKSIESRANDAILALKNKDANKLATLVHPDKGVRFSPYAYVNIEKDLIFTSPQIHGIFADKTKYHWGQYDRSGETIELTFEEYYKRFIYDQDFANAEKVSYNRVIGRSNTTNNSFEVYSDSIIVEYHFSGFDPQYNGMDWRSLRLVFEKEDGVWYLVGISHDEWAI